MWKVITAGDGWVYNAQTDQWQRVFGSGLEAKAYNFAEEVMEQTIYGVSPNGFCREPSTNVEPHERRSHTPDAAHEARVLGAGGLCPPSP